MKIIMMDNHVKGNENHVEDNNVATLRMCISFGGFLLEIRAMEGEEGVAGGF